MGISDWTYALSQVNAIGGSLLNYKNNVDSGASKAQAGAEALTLGATNIFRNEWAKDMSERGNNFGWAINCLTDYSDTASSQKGLFGLAIADMPPLWGGGCFGGGYMPPLFGGHCHSHGASFGGLYLGGHMPHMPFSTHSHMPMFRGGGSVFIRNNFYC